MKRHVSAICALLLLAAPMSARVRTDQISITLSNQAEHDIDARLFVFKMPHDMRQVNLTGVKKGRLKNYSGASLILHEKGKRILEVPLQQSASQEEELVKILFTIEQKFLDEAILRISCSDEKESIRIYDFHLATYL